MSATHLCSCWGGTRNSTNMRSPNMSIWLAGWHSSSAGYRLAHLGQGEVRGEHLPDLLVSGMSGSPSGGRIVSHGVNGGGGADSLLGFVWNHSFFYTATLASGTTQLWFIWLRQWLKWRTSAQHCLQIRWDGECKSSDNPPPAPPFFPQSSAWLAPQLVSQNDTYSNRNVSEHSGEWVTMGMCYDSQLSQVTGSATCNSRSGPPAHPCFCH